MVKAWDHFVPRDMVFGHFFPIHALKCLHYWISGPTSTGPVELGGQRGRSPPLPQYFENFTYVSRNQPKNCKNLGWVILGLLPPPTMLSFAVSHAKNWERLATLKTMWNMKFLPTLVISLCLEVWPAAPKPLSPIWKLASDFLKNPKGGPFYVKKFFCLWF